MEWKAFFHQNPDLTTSTEPMNLYSDIKISNLSQAPTQNNIIGELKTKLLGWIANHKTKAPKSNLTELEQRGKKWISEKIKAELIFITKADKGGATLIMNYKDVEEAVKKNSSQASQKTKTSQNKLPNTELNPLMHTHLSKSTNCQRTT